MQNTRIVIFLFLLLGAARWDVSAQVMDVTNADIRYASVTTINERSVVVPDAATFNVSTGDIVLMIQMKGAILYDTPPQPDSYDEVTSGNYEFLMVEYVSGNEIFFVKPFLRTYSADANVQVITVPFADELRVNSALNVKGWDATKTGGVMALIGLKKITLNASINAVGAGFVGADPADDPLYTEGCMSTLSGFILTSDSDSSGLKGEGVHHPTFLYNRGTSYVINGGGAGNGRMSGGGGGGGYGQGGSGGIQDASLGCSTFGIGGKGGKIIQNKFYTQVKNRLIMGGGGGIGTHISGTSPKKAGDGGGIVILLTDSLVANSATINVSGESVTGTSDAGGSGGGGAGVVVLDINYFQGICTVAASGGAGGSTFVTENAGTCITGTGTGGGGGGGLVWFSSGSSYPGLTVQVAAGSRGLIVPGTGTGCLSRLGAFGVAGTTLTGVQLPLNGFLFNYLYKSNDTICAGTAPDAIEASMPKGRVGAFTFQWQSSIDGSVFNNVSNQGVGDSIIYSPGVLHRTTWFRRIVSTGSGAGLQRDTSNILKIFAWDSIQGNAIASNQLLCAGDMSATLTGNTTSGGNGSYSWLWERKTPAGSWSAAGGVNQTFAPGVLFQTYHYRRRVSSAFGHCLDTSNTVVITVQNDITGNTLTGNQTICTADIAANLSGGTIAGGDESNYNYLWQSSPNLSVWNNAAGNPSTAVYSPGSPVSTTHLRRIITSGVCEDTSDNVVTVTVLPSLTGYAIGADQKICFNEVPNPLIGTGTPTGGNGAGTYTYRWQQGANNSVFTDISGGLSASYSPGPLTDTVWYRRIITSAQCIDTSNTLKITVVPQIFNNLITPSDSICYGQKPSDFDESVATGGNGVFDYVWETNTGSGFTTAPGMSAGDDYITPSLYLSTIYRRKATSDGCETNSSEVTITVFDTLSNNHIENEPYIENCYNQVLVAQASEPQGGQPGDRKYLWQQSNDNVNWFAATSSQGHSGQNYTSDPLIDSLYLRRIVASGPENECIDTTISTLVHINPLPTAQLKPFDTVVCDRTDLALMVQATGEVPLQLVFSDIGEYSINNLSDEILLTADALGLQSMLYTIAFDSVQDNNGCQAVAMDGIVNMEVLGFPSADAGTDIAVCDSVAILAALVPEFGESLWQNPDFIFTDASVPNSGIRPAARLDTAIFGELVWRVANDFCISYDTLNIRFYKQPPLAEIPADKIELFEKFDTPIEAEVPSIGHGVWSVTRGYGVFEDSLAAATIIDSLHYGDNLVAWTVTNGVCIVVTDSILITVASVTPTNAFSPNNDGINDRYEILGLKKEEGNELVVFNRWGNQVFKSEKYQNDWEGKDSNGNPLPDDTYYYVFKAYTGEVKTGFIIIRR